MENDQKITKVIISIFLLGLIVFSVVLRLPQVNRSLGDQHEYVTASVLITLETWRAEGGLFHKFAPVQTYPSEVNKYIEWVTTRVMDSKGNSYYVTYPPFSLIVAYVIIQIFSLPINPLTLEMMGIVFHIIGALFLYALMQEILEGYGGNPFGPLIAAAWYLLFNVNLWMYTLVYSWDTLWHHLFIIELLFFIRYLKVINSNPAVARRNMLIAGIFSFLTIYTEYEGVVGAVGMIIYLASLKNTKHVFAMKTLILSVIAAFLLALIQYSSVAGLGQYLAIMSEKIGSYGSIGYVAKMQNPTQAFKSYRELLWYVPQAVLLLGGISVLSIFLSKTTIRIKYGALLVGLLLLLIVVHHGFFLEDVATHEFGMLKTALLLSIVFGVLYSFISYHGRLQMVLLSMASLVIGAGLLSSVQSYQVLSSVRPNPDKYKELADSIQRVRSKDEVVFAISTQPIYPQVVYYLHQNIKEVENEEQARMWLRARGQKHGKVLYIDKYFHLYKFRSL